MEFKFETELNLKYLEEIYLTNIKYCSKIIKIIKNLQINGKNLNQINEFNNNLSFCATHYNNEEKNKSEVEDKSLNHFKSNNIIKLDKKNNKISNVEQIIFKIIKVETENNVKYKCMLEGIISELLWVKKELIEFKLSLNSKLKELKKNLNSKLNVYASILRQIKKYENLIQNSIVTILESNFIIDVNDCQPNLNLSRNFNINLSQEEQIGLNEGNFAEDCCNVYQLIVNSIKDDELLNSFFYPVYSFPYNLLNTVNNNRHSVHDNNKWNKCFKFQDGSYKNCLNPIKCSRNNSNNNSSNNNNNNYVNNEDEKIKIKSKCKILCELFLNNFRDFGNYNNYIKLLEKCDSVKKEVVLELKRYNYKVEEIVKEFKRNMARTNRSYKDILGNLIIKYYVNRFSSYDMITRELYSIKSNELEVINESEVISEICSKVLRFYSGGTCENYCNFMRKLDSQMDLNDKLGILSYISEYNEYLNGICKYYSEVQGNISNNGGNGLINIVYIYVKQVLKSVMVVYNKIFDVILLFNYNYSNCYSFQSVPKLELGHMLRANELTTIACTGSSNLLYDIRNVYVLCLIYGLSGYFPLLNNNSNSNNNSNNNNSNNSNNNNSNNTCNNRNNTSPSTTSREVNSKLIHVLIQSNNLLYAHFLDNNNNNCCNNNNNKWINNNNYNNNINRMNLNKVLYKLKCSFWGHVSLKGCLLLSMNRIWFCTSLDKNSIFAKKPLLTIDVVNVDNVTIDEERFVVTLVNGYKYIFYLHYVPNINIINHIHNIYCGYKDKDNKLLSDDDDDNIFKLTYSCNDISIKINNNRVVVNDNVNMILISEGDYEINIDELFKLIMSSNTDGISLVSRCRIEMGAKNFNPCKQDIVNYRLCKDYCEDDDDVKIHNLNHIILNKILRYDIQNQNPILSKFNTIENIKYIFQSKRIIYISISNLENKPYNDMFYNVYIIIINYNNVNDIINMKIYSNIIFNKKLIFNNIIKKEIISKTVKATQVIINNLNKYKIRSCIINNDINILDKRTKCIKSNKLMIIIVLFIVILFGRMF